MARGIGTEVAGAAWVEVTVPTPDGTLSALAELSEDALVEEETLADTIEVRDALNRRLAMHPARVEIDSPRVRASLRV